MKTGPDPAMSRPLRPRRSALYVGASNPRAIDKARGLDCDVVILDLEDLVSPSEKMAARAAAVTAATGGGFGPREVVIRVNGLDTPWGADDLAACAAAGADAILAPKITCPKDVEAVRGHAGPRPGLWLMIETAAAVLAAAEIGAASRRAEVDAWVIGSNDLAKDLRLPQPPDRPGLVGPLSQCVVAARAFGLTILDGIYMDVTDGDGFARQAAQAVALGFDGKSLVHPRQIGPANDAFTPDDEALARARAVVDAFAAPAARGQAVVEALGRVYERPQLDDARRLLAMMERISARARGGA